MADVKGYLNVCMDKRFWKKATEMFAEKAGLTTTDFWVETNPGGVNTLENMTGQDYAASNGAVIFGWGAHGSHCGGQPGVSDEESKARLMKKIDEKKAKFPTAKHYGLFLTEDFSEIWEA
jgi:hypothetical protein